MAKAAGERGVKLLGVWGSPFSCRVEVALKLKGVSYEYIKEDITNKSPLLLKYNPVHKKIPVLVHDGKPLAESLVILEYIDEVWTDNPILPRDPPQRALARFWAKFIDDKCVFAIRQAFSSRDEKALAEARENLKVLEGEVKGKRFFGGESIGIADIAGLFIAFWVRVIQDAMEQQLLLTEEEFPNLWKWADELLEVGVIKENLPDRDRLLAFFKTRFGG